MSRRNLELPLHRMLDHAREARILLKGKSLKGFVDDRMLGLAIVRLMDLERILRMLWSPSPPLRQWPEAMAALALNINALI